MQITIFNNISEAIVVDKILEQTTIVEAQLQEECSILNPTLVITVNTGNISSNYCFIPKFNRYYYITNITILDGNRCRIDCKVDVLMSFRDQIRETTQNIVRQESLYNMYLQDSNMQVTAKSMRQALNFKPPTEGWKLQHGNNASDLCYVLNTL